MGNILTQKRNGGGTSATALDELTYNYHTTTDGLVSNRLYQVNDVVSAGNYTDDIDDQGTFNNTHSTIETANNYGYDELGNLVRDVQEEIASIEWTVYGKMKKITRNSGSTKADLEFGYDASGNRLWKKVTPKGSGAVTSTYYYLRDAQGNEMCRYVKYTNTTSQLMYVAQEHSIYGSSRVGVDGRKDTLYLGAAYTPTWGGANTSRRALGLKSFELANHLGNVLVTVSDKPIYKVSSGTIYFQPEVSSISDYYPFGAPIQGRSAAFGSEYRFGFNGKENDGESETQDYGMRINDCRLGRFLSVDPLSMDYAWNSVYAFAENKVIQSIDLDGLEELNVNLPPNQTGFVKLGTINVCQVFLIVDQGKGAINHFYCNEFNDVMSTGNRIGTHNFLVSQLPTPNEEMEILVGKKYRWAKKALSGDISAIKKLETHGISEVYDLDIQFDVSAQCSETIETAMSVYLSNQNAFGIIMLQMSAEEILYCPSRVHPILKEANEIFKDSEVGGIATNDQLLRYGGHNFAVMPIDESEWPSGDIEERAAHEAGHSMSIWHMHKGKEGKHITIDYEYKSEGLGSNTNITVSTQNIINIVNDKKNRQTIKND
jgi:RHS repeat-associated protein